MRYELKSIPIWPVVKVGFFVNLIVGLIFGILYAMFLIPIIALMTSIPEFQSGEFNMDAAPLGVLVIIVPIMSALSGAFFGTISLVIITFIYNMTAKFIGGVELNLTRTEIQPDMPAPTQPAATHTEPVQQTPPPPPPVESAPPPPPPPPEDPPSQAPGKTGPDGESNT